MIIEFFFFFCDSVRSNPKAHSVFTQDMCDVLQGPACNRYPSLLCIPLSPLQNTRKPRPWSRTGRWGLTGKGRRSGNLGPFTPACSSRHWTSASSRPSTSPCQRGQTWQPNWAWHKPRYCAGHSCLLVYVKNINPSDAPLCFYSKARLTFVNFLW